MIEISSTSNEHFKRWRDLESARGIKKHQEFFLMGEKLICEFLENPNFKIKAEILTADLPSITAAFPAAKQQKFPIFKMAQGLFNEIDFLGTHFNLLVLEPKEIPVFDCASKPLGLEVVCPLGDPSNLGALARSSLAFGASKMILTSEAASPYLPKSVKASAGAILKLAFARGESLTSLASTQKELFALDMSGEPIESFQWPRHLRLLVGEEGPGLQKLDLQNRLRIATGRVESLNATVAASIALYSYAQNHTP